MAFEEARANAGLLARQSELLDFLLDDVSYGSVVEKTGMKKQNVKKSRERIIRKIAYHYHK
jgi:hypothetical protein